MIFVSNRLCAMSVVLALLSACAAEVKKDSAQSGQTNTVAADKVPGRAADKTAVDPDRDSTAAKNDPKAVDPETLSIAELLKLATVKPRVFNAGGGKIHSGFDGVNVFKALVDVGVDIYLPSDLEAKLSDEKLEAFYNGPEYISLVTAKGTEMPASLTIDPAFATSVQLDTYPGGKVFVLTMLKAGTAVGTAKVGSTEIPLSIVIASYTAAQVNAGRQRYMTAVAGATPSPACATCHRSAMGADHAPYQMAQYTDAALLSTVEIGKNTDDGYMTRIVHKMSFNTAADKAGIIPYLRSLDPTLFTNDEVK